MIKAKITYDPYHMKTSLNIDGQNVKKNSGMYENIKKYIKQEIPLQSWIDASAFQSWKGLLIEIIGDTNEDAIEFTYRGRKIDFEDFQESMLYQSKYENNGMYDIDVSFIPAFIYDDKDMLERVKTAYSIIQSDDFKKIIDNKVLEFGEDSCLYQEYQNLEAVYSNAMDSEFRIVFSGMYTCGKSTLINAVLGKEILPTSDGTCTSKIFKIIHDSTIEFATMRCVDKNGKVVVAEKAYTEQELADKFAEIFPRGTDNELLPSNPASIETVIIKTNISSLYPENAKYDEKSMQLVVIDTPGTSSGEGNMVENGPAHVDITRGIIESDKKEIIILATSAIEDKDDSIQDFLDMVDNGDDQGAYDQRFLFVLNKADCCSFKPGESWSTKLSGIKNYYVGKKDNKNRKIQNPRFFPTSALGAYKVRAQKTKQDAKYKAVEANYYFYDDDEEMYVPNPKKANFHFDEFCATSQSIKNDIAQMLDASKKSEKKAAEKRKEEVLLHSGIVSLEMAIQDYIERYAFPLKVKTLIRSYEAIFKEVDQVLSITSTKFQKAVIARTDLEKEKEQKEDEKLKEEKIKESLVAVTKAVLEKKQRLENITQDFRSSSRQVAKDIKSTMEITLGEAEKQGNYKKQAFSINPNALQDEIRKIVEDGATKCYQMLDFQLNSNKQKIKEIEAEITSFFDEVKSTINFGKDFKIECTTSYAKINASGISQVKRLTKTVRNPKWDSGFFLFRPIKRLFISKDITVDNGLDTEKLKEIIVNLRFEMNHSVDALFNNIENELNAAKNILIDNMQALEKEVNEYSRRILAINTSVNAIVDDIDAKLAFENELREALLIIHKIHSALPFDFEDEEMEEEE